MPGATFLVHHWPKLDPRSPMKGPAGPAGVLKPLGIPLPGSFAWVRALLEPVGGVLVSLGLQTRGWALRFAIDVLVALALVKRRMGRDAFVYLKAWGWELEFVLLAHAPPLAVTGPGATAPGALFGL